MTVVAYLKANEENLTIEHFDVDMHWKSMTFKFEKIAGRFSTLADLTMNQVWKKISKSWSSFTYVHMLYSLAWATLW